jgi:hypothetical protein
LSWLAKEHDPIRVRAFEVVVHAPAVGGLGEFLYTTVLIGKMVAEDFFESSLETAFPGVGLVAIYSFKILLTEFKLSRSSVDPGL